MTNLERRVGTANMAEYRVGIRAHQPLAGARPARSNDMPEKIGVLPGRTPRNHERPEMADGLCAAII